MASLCIVEKKKRKTGVKRITTLNEYVQEVMAFNFNQLPLHSFIYSTTCLPLFAVD